MTMIKFTKEHEWIKIEEGAALIGISHFAQHSLGDIVFVELPKIGGKLTAGKAFGSIESVKAVSELFAPVSGNVVDVNKTLEDAPELLNEDAYANWIVKVELDDENELASLMIESEYEEFCKNEK